jgi:hypothetical protein
MQKQFILLLGMFLASYVSVAAQTRAPQFVLVQERMASIRIIVRTVPAPMLAASLHLPENPGASAAPLSYQFAEAYESSRGLEGLKNLLAVRTVRTLFLTQSSVPLVQLWGGRFSLDGFTSTLHMQSAQLGPSIAGGPQEFRPPPQSHPGGSAYGVSLSFYFGREAQTGHPKQIWRCLARMVGAAR